MFYPASMGIDRRPTEDILVARLNGAAQRLAGWDPPEGQERQLAIEDLRTIGGPNIEPYAHAAGVILGYHPPGSVSHGLYRNAALLLLDAAGLAEDDERVQHWVTVGEERRNRAAAAHRAGDHWDGRGR